MDDAELDTTHGDGLVRRRARRGSTHLGTEGTVNVAAVDLYAHPPSGPSAIYFDDVSLSNLPFLDGFESEDARNWHYTLP